MVDASDKVSLLDERRVALEELRERNRAAEQARALDIEERKAAHATRTSTAEAQTRIPVTLVSLVSAVVGGLASLAVAYVTGVFGVENTREESAGQITLERQKFFNQMISDALEEVSDKKRAERIKFMVDIGIFDSELNTAKLREYAEREQLPQGLSGNTEGVDFFFGGGTPALDIFSSSDGVNILKEAGVLQRAEGLATVLAVLHDESAGFRFMVEQTPRPMIEDKYANLAGNNGPEDAWKYRGRGFLMITGRENYLRMGRLLDIDLLASPDMAAEPLTALRIALQYMSERRMRGKSLIELANEGDIDTVLRGVRGRPIRLEFVVQIRERYLAAIHDPRFATHPLVEALNRP